jgi:hypothetical protein
MSEFERRNRPERSKDQAERVNNERAKNDDSSALGRYYDTSSLKKALAGTATTTMDTLKLRKPHKLDFDLVTDTIIDLSSIHNILFTTAESQGLNSQDVITDGVENWLKKV